MHQIIGLPYTLNAPLNKVIEFAIKAGVLVEIHSKPVSYILPPPRKSKVGNGQIVCEDMLRWLRCEDPQHNHPWVSVVNPMSVTAIPSCHQFALTQKCGCTASMCDTMFYHWTAQDRQVLARTGVLPVYTAPAHCANPSLSFADLYSRLSPEMRADIDSVVAAGVFAESDFQSLAVVRAIEACSVSQARAACKTLQEYSVRSHFRDSASSGLKWVETITNTRYFCVV